MIITGMAHFESVCKNKLVEWYNQSDNINYKALLSTTVSGDGIYAEYTYNGDKQEMYEDVYKKASNRCLKSE